MQEAACRFSGAILASYECERRAKLNDCLLRIPRTETAYPCDRRSDALGYSN